MTGYKKEYYNKYKDKQK